MVSSPIAVEDLDLVMPLVIPFIEHIAVAYDGDSVSEVERMLRARIATLHWYGTEGFAVLTWTPGECHIHTAASFERGANINALSALKNVGAYAGQFGILGLTFTTVRKGFGPLAKKWGLHVVSRVGQTVTYGMNI